MIEFQLLTFLAQLNRSFVLYITDIANIFCFLLSFAVCLSCFYGPGDRTK